MLLILTRAQKIALLIIGLLVLILVVFAFFLKSSRPETPTPEVPPVVTPPSSLPTAGPRRPGVVTPTVAPETAPTAPSAVVRPSALINEYASTAHLGTNGEIYYFKPADGFFYRLSAGGTPEKLPSEVFKGAQTVVWSGTRDQAVVSFPDGANVLHDFVTGSRVVLPKTWREFSFSPTGDEFAFKILNDNPDKRWLARAKTDGSGVTVFQPLGNNADKVTVNWSPTGQIAGWYTQPKDLKRHEVFFLGFQGENLRSMLIEGYNPLGRWSPGGDRLLYSVVDIDTKGYPPTLWIVEASGDNIGRGRLQLPVQTWANKCIFAGETSVYCAVPRELPFGGGFEREKVTTGDDLYKIDLTTGLKSPLASFGSRTYLVKDLMLSPDGSLLYFVDQRTGNVQSVSTVVP